MNPYLSFVVGARNDNYGGDFLGRLQVFVDGLLAMWKRHDLNAELVIVEWNPPADRPRLKNAIRWPKSPTLDRVSIVEVPNEVHRRFPNSNRMPIFEYIAKNVGIRRAKGEFVLSTNPDILFSDRLMRSFAARHLEPNSFYRVNRYDVAENISVNRSIVRQLRFCSLRAFRFHHAGGSMSLDRSLRLRHYVSQIVPWFRPLKMIHELRNRQEGVPSPVETPVSTSKYPSVHENASGDFMLMSAESWRSLRGYPEFTTHSHIDSYLVYVAAVAGLRQVVLRDPIYHQEHDRSEQNARPLTILEKIPAFLEMLETRRPHIANTENWGLGDFELESFSMTADDRLKESVPAHPNLEAQQQRTAQ